MERHYADAIRQGASGARDGLTWRHDIASRVAAAPPQFNVMWDMVHFDMPPDPIAHAVAVQDALPAGTWAIAINEPTIHAEFNNLDGSWSVVETAIRMMKAAPRLRYAACDALCTFAPDRWWAMDRLVESGLIELVGINYYPHSAEAPLRDIIREARRRYPGIPVAITETSWHVGHPDLPVGEMRLQWLQHIQQECEIGGGVQFICYYPWLDMPDWDHPDQDRWPCGWPVDLCAAIQQSVD